MSEFFKPYEGSRPFFFISYAHRQSAEAVDTIRILHDKGYRLWYDEGIPAGSDWPANIAQHMQDCERVIFFLSARAMESPNCYSEMRTAYRLGKKVLVVRLEEAETEERWHKLLDGRQEIPLLDSPEKRAAAILDSGFLSKRYRRSWTEAVPWRAFGLAASLLLFLAAAGTLGALATGRWTPIPPAPPIETPAPTPEPTPPEVVEAGGAERYFTVGFPDSLQKRAILRALDTQDEVYRWQLAEIPELYVCGGVVTDGFDSISFDADGTGYAKGAPVYMGSIEDLSLFAYTVRLEKLALACQPLKSVAGLNGLLLLRELSLAGSTVGNLSALTELPSLETIHLEHTAVTDLRPLEALPKLRTVTVSRDMLPLTWSDGAPFTVVLVP